MAPKIALGGKTCLYFKLCALSNSLAAVQAEVPYRRHLLVFWYVGMVVLEKASGPFYSSQI